jgi:hypothetical protein
MANLLSYLDENQAFQNLKQFQEEQKEAYKERTQQGITGFVESLPIAAHLLYKGKELYQQGSKLASKAEEAVTKVQEGAQKIGSAVQEGASKIESSVGKLKGVGEEALDKGQSLIGETAAKAESLVGQTADRITTSGSSMLSKAGNNMSQKMFQNEFERDPESEDVSMTENRDLFTKVKNIFRGGETGTPEAPGLAEAEGLGKDVLSAGKEALSVGKNALSEGVEAAGNIATKAVGAASEAASAAVEAGTTIGAVASEAIPVVGELAAIGFGIYDLIHSFADKPHIYNVARPVYAAGI